VRCLPSDPPELRAFLESLEGIDGRAEIGRKQRVLKSALVGGMAQGQAAAVALDAGTEGALDDVLGL
jgi:hypothetical protein